MAAKDVYHDSVVRALQKDGWTITHDPLIIKYGLRNMLIDLGAERVLAAERDGKRIAVEIKSFLKPSPIQDLKEAAGQFLLYDEALEDFPTESDRLLYVAIRETAYHTVFNDDAPRRRLRRGKLRLIVFDEIDEVIKQWIP